MTCSRGVALLVAAGLTGAVAGTGGCSVGFGTNAGICGANASGYVPSAMTPPWAHPGACATTEIQAFVTACGANATGTSCDSWRSAEASSGAGTACLDCVFTNQTGPRWGVLVCDPNDTCSLNTPGCIDVALGQTALETAAGGSGSCGDLLQDAFGCEDYVCGSCTDLDGGTSNSDACSTHTSEHECASYVTAFSSSSGPCGSLIAGDGGSASSACFVSTDADLTVMATLLCGAP